MRAAAATHTLPTRAAAATHTLPPPCRPQGFSWAHFFVDGGGKMDDCTVVVAFVQPAGDTGPASPAASQVGEIISAQLLKACPRGPMMDGSTARTSRERTLQWGAHARTPPPARAVQHAGRGARQPTEAEPPELARQPRGPLKLDARACAWGVCARVRVLVRVRVCMYARA